MPRRPLKSPPPPQKKDSHIRAVLTPLPHRAPRGSQKRTNGGRSLNAPSNDPSLSRVHSWLAARTQWQRRGLAFVAGALATLAHAPFQLTPFYIVAITVLVWLIDGAATLGATAWGRLGRGFALGWWFGVGHLITGLYWVSSAFMVDSGAWGPMWGIPATIALAASLALFWALGCAAAIALWTTDIRRIAWFAVCVFASEWLRGNILTGFPWLLPGYVWTPGEPLS